MSAGASSYRDFIVEAFIEPIRSVIMIDDQYPTLEAMMDAFLNDNAPNDNLIEKWRKDSLKLRTIIDEFRAGKATKQPLIVDIHNGQNISASEDKLVANHLHQTDLLVLDFILDAEDNDYKKALDILHSLGQNDHYNLCIVHTEEPIPDTFMKIALALGSPVTSQPNWAAYDYESIADEIESIAYDNPGNEEIEQSLSGTVDAGEYLQFKMKTTANQARGRLFGRVRSIINDETGKSLIDPQKALYFALASFERKINSIVSSHQLPDPLEFEIQNQGSNWIRNNKLFICVVKKTDAAVHLISELTSALEAWEPTPHRLILNKARAIIEQQGVHVEDRALNNKTMQAGWYSQALNSNQPEQNKLQIQKLFREQWSGFQLPVEDQIIPFGEKVIANDILSGDAPAEVISKRFDGIDLTEPNSEIKVLLELNAHSCSTKPSGNHLTTGHIFNLEGGDDPNKELWLCLTPECDMFPHPESNGRKKEVAPNIPFRAVKLRKDDDPQKALEDANKNTVVFLKRNNGVQCYRFAIGDTGNPWQEEMFVLEGGKIDGPELSLKVAKMALNDETKLPEFQIIESAKVVAQLRSDYAHNFVQKLGAANTRIGLDYVALETE